MGENINAQLFRKFQTHFWLKHQISKYFHAPALWCLSHSLWSFHFKPPPRKMHSHCDNSLLKIFIIKYYQIHRENQQYYLQMAFIRISYSISCICSCFKQSECNHSYSINFNSIECMDDELANEIWQIVR